MRIVVAAVSVICRAPPKKYILQTSRFRLWYGVLLILNHYFTTHRKHMPELILKLIIINIISQLILFLWRETSNHSRVTRWHSHKFALVVKTVWLCERWNEWDFEYLTMNETELWVEPIQYFNGHSLKRLIDVFWGFKYHLFAKAIWCTILEGSNQFVCATNAIVDSIAWSLKLGIDAAHINVAVCVSDWDLLWHVYIAVSEMTVKYERRQFDPSLSMEVPVKKRSCICHLLIRCIVLPLTIKNSESKISRVLITIREAQISLAMKQILLHLAVKLS